MTYTLITRDGTVQQFYIQSVAEMYQRTNGGVIVTAAILINEMVEA